MTDAFSRDRNRDDCLRRGDVGGAPILPGAAGETARGVRGRLRAARWGRRSGRDGVPASVCRAAGVVQSQTCRSRMLPGLPRAASLRQVIKMF